MKVADAMPRPVPRKKGEPRISRATKRKHAKMVYRLWKKGKLKARIEAAEDKCQ